MKANVNERQKKALKKICEAGIYAIEKRSTPDNIKALRKYIDCVKEELIYYFYPNFDSFTNNTDSKAAVDKKYDIAMEKYFYIINHSTLLTNSILNYDESKSKENGFQGYFLRTITPTAEKAKHKFNNSNIRSGLVSVFTDADQRLLNKIYNDFKEELLQYADDYTIKIIAEKIGTSEKKVKELLASRKNSYCTNFTINADEDSFEYDIAVNDGYDEEENQPDNLQSDQEFIKLLLLLNKLYFESFNDRDKRVFPPAFTGKHIENRAKEVQSFNKIPNLKTLAENYWDELDLPLHRKLYANGKYICMVKDIFDYSISNHIILNGKQIAEMIEVSNSTLTKTVDKVYKKINEYFKENKGEL